MGVGPEVEPDLSSVTLHPGDRYLLCSDGLTGPVGEREIADLLGRYEPEDATRSLVALANENGGPDNITAVAVLYPDPSRITDNHELPRDEALRDADDRDASRRRRAVKIGLAAAVVALALLGSILTLVLSSS